MPLVFFGKKMTKIYNFSAGPAMLPVSVMQKAQSEFLDWQSMGRSVMEISHRSKEYIAVAETAEQDLRELLTVPDNYKVLFAQGGGRGQFSALPMNLKMRADSADFLLTGSWSVGALKEASKFFENKRGGRNSYARWFEHCPKYYCISS